MNKNLLIGIMTIIIVALIIFILIPGLDKNGPYTYPTLRDARSADLDEKGWIPTSFPDCLKDVKIVTNVDTNEAFYEFTLPADCR